MLLSLSSFISKVSTMADSTIRMVVDCQEMSAEQTAQIFQQKGKIGYFLFSERTIKEEDLKDLPEIKTDRNEKTPGQRLRAVLYILWEQTKNPLGFEQFYREQMDAYINQIKARLL